MPRVNTPKKAKVVAWLQVNFTNMALPRPHHSPPVYGDIRAKAEPANGTEQWRAGRDPRGEEVCKKQREPMTGDWIKSPGSDAHSL